MSIRSYVANISLVNSFSEVINWTINLFLKSARKIKLKVEFAEDKFKRHQCQCKILYYDLNILYNLSQQLKINKRIDRITKKFKISEFF